MKKIISLFSYFRKLDKRNRQFPTKTADTKKKVNKPNYPDTNKRSTYRQKLSLFECIYLLVG